MRPLTGSVYDCSVLQGSQILIFIFPKKRRKMVEIYFKVKPGQKNFRVEDGTMPEVSLEAEAENGRANAHLLEKLEQITGERPGIISGHKSRRKKLVFDQDEEVVREKISKVSK